MSEGHELAVELVANTGWDPRILVCQNGELVQTFIIVTQRYVVLVDTLINPETAGAMMALARPYLTDRRRLLVVNTHADYDHAWGNQLFAGPEATFLAPIIGTYLCAERLQSEEASDSLAQMRQTEPAIFNPVRLTPPTILFESRLQIDGGDLTLELLPTPGHTPDHVSIYLPEIDTLLAADGAELPFPFARTIEGLPQLRDSLSQMAELDAATVLYCHAPVATGPSLLQANIDYFDTLEEYCRRALDRGVPPDPAADEDLEALVGCRYQSAVPDHPAWENVHEFYRNQGHSQQIRMMLAYLATTS